MSIDSFGEAGLFTRETYRDTERLNRMIENLRTNAKRQSIQNDSTINITEVNDWSDTLSLYENMLDTEQQRNLQQTQDANTKRLREQRAKDIENFKNSCLGITQENETRLSVLGALLLSGTVNRNLTQDIVNNNGDTQCSTTRALITTNGRGNQVLQTVSMDYDLGAVFKTVVNLTTGDTIVYLCFSDSEVVEVTEDYIEVTESENPELGNSIRKIYDTLKRTAGLTSKNTKNNTSENPLHILPENVDKRDLAQVKKAFKDLYNIVDITNDEISDAEWGQIYNMYMRSLLSESKDSELNETDFTEDTSYNKNFNPAYFNPSVKFIDRVKNPEDDTDLLHIYAVTEDGNDVRIELDLNSEFPIVTLQSLDENNEFQNMTLSQQLTFKTIYPELFQSFINLGLVEKENFDPYTEICGNPKTTDLVLQSMGYVESKEGLDTYMNSVLQRNSKPLQDSDSSLFIDKIPELNKLLDMNAQLSENIEINGNSYSTIGSALKHYSMLAYANYMLQEGHTEDEVNDMFKSWMQDDECTISYLLENDDTDLLEFYVTEAMQAIFPQLLNTNPSLVQAIRSVGQPLESSGSNSTLDKIMLKVINQKIRQYKSVLPGHHPITARVSSPYLLHSSKKGCRSLGERLSSRCFTAIYDMPVGMTPMDFDVDVLESYGVGPDDTYSQEDWEEFFPKICEEQEMLNYIRNSDVTILTQEGYDYAKNYLEKCGKPYILIDTANLEAALSMYNSEDAPITSVNFIGNFNDAEMERIAEGLTSFTSRTPTPRSVGANTTHIDNLDMMRYVPYWEKDNDRRCLSVSDIQLLSTNLADMASMVLRDLREGNPVEGFEEWQSVDFTGKSSLEILKQITPSTFIPLLKKKFVSTVETKSAEASGEVELANASQLVDIYFEDLLYRASSEIKKREHFVLSKTKTSTLVQNDTADYGNDSESIMEEEGSVLEHWQVESSTVDVSATVSIETQQFFMGIPELDSTGKPKISKFGMPSFMPANSVKHCLNNWLAGMDTLTEMREYLREKAKYSPWIKPVIEKLDTPDGENEQFKSEFFTMMNCSRSNYGSLDFYGKGYVFNRIKNENPALTRTMSTIQAQMVQSKIELFLIGDPKKEAAMLDFIDVSKAMNDYALSLYNIYKESLRYGRKSEIEVREEMDRILASPEHVESHNLFINNLHHLYKDILKMDVSREDCAQITSFPEVVNICKGLQRMATTLTYVMTGDATFNLFDNTGEDFKNSLKANRDKDRRYLEASIFDYELNEGVKNKYFIGGDLRNVLRPITEVMSNYSDAVTYHNGKTYQRYAMPSFLTYMNEKLQTTQGAMQFRETYYEDNPLFRNVWWNSYPSQYNRVPLAMAPVFSIFDNSYFKHKRQLTQQNKEYMRDMSDLDVQLGEIIEFLNATGEIEELGMVERKNSFELREIDERYQLPYPTAWFKVPTMADKPASEWLMLPTWGEQFSSSRIETLPHRSVVMCQYLDMEISRMRTVKARQKYLRGKLRQSMSEEDYNALSEEQIQKKIKELPEYIANYDTSDLSFKYLKWLNDPSSDSVFVNQIQQEVDFRKLLGKMLEGTITDEERNNFRDAFLKITDNYMDKSFMLMLNHLKATGLYSIIESYLPEVKGQARLKDFIWSHKINTIAMIQMVHGDLSFYKNDTDAQKRFAQAHSSTRKPNTEACSPTVGNHKGEKVSDGRHRCVILKDFVSASNMTPYMKALYEKMIQNEKDPVMKGYYEAELAQRLEEYKKVNQTDGQAFNTPSSIRKKLVMLGHWTTKQEETYQKFRKWFYYEHIRKDSAKASEYRLTPQEINEDFVKVLKPFFYGFYDVDSKVGRESPNSTIRVPLQLKNSEFTMFPIGVMGEENQTTANLMNSLFISMESTYYDEDGNYLPDGVDSVQFASCAKVGCSGVIDLTSFENDKENGEAKATEVLRRCMTGKGTKLQSQTTDNMLVDSRYDNDYVHESPYNCWGDQVQVHSEFTDGGMADTSQARIIIQTDLADTDGAGQQVKYDMGDGTEGTKEEFQKKFNDLYAEKIRLAINTLKQELGLDKEDVIRQNELLSKMLIEEAEKSPSRYSIEFIRSLGLTPTGDFKIPLSDPETAGNVEALCNSLVRNRVYRDSVEGSPVAQVSCFGKSESLQVRFKDSEGKPLMTRKEFEKAHPGKSFEDYVKEHAHSLDSLEVYITMPSSQLKQFMDKDGKVDMDLIQTIAPDMLKAIGTRVPTEQKYSILPLKIVGILPSAVGDGVILPQDITLLTGSNFDIDKLYTRLMKVLIGNKYKDSTNNRDIYKQAVAIWEGKLSEAKNFTERQMLLKARKEFINNECARLENEALDRLVEQFKSSEYCTDDLKELKDKDIKALIMELGEGKKDSEFSVQDKAVMKFLYYQEDDSKKSRKDQINNQLFNMTMGILQHPQTLSEILTPGGYQKLKAETYRIKAFKEGFINPKTQKPYTLSELDEVSLEELESQNPHDIDITDFIDDTKAYDMNQAAKNLVAIAASTRIAHAQLTEVKDAWVDMESIDFDLVGLSIGDSFRIPEKIQIGIERNEVDKEPVSKILARFLTASLDNAKDPFLQNANINQFTFTLAMSMARAGLPEKLILQLMSTNPMGQAVQTCKQRKIEGNASIMTVIKSRMKYLERTLGKETCIKASLTEGDLEMLLKDDMSWTPPSNEDGENFTTVRENRYMQVEYKLLSIISGFKLVGDQFMMADSVTKFNSAQNAPGPTVIGCKLMLQQLRSFDSEKENYHIVHEDGSRVDLVGNELSERPSLLEQCPISRAYLETYNVAMQLNQHSSASNSRMDEVIKMFAHMPFAITHLKNTGNLDKQLNNFFMTWNYVSCITQKNKLDKGDYYDTMRKDADELVTNFEKLKTDYKRRFTEDSDNALLQILSIDLNPAVENPTKESDVLCISKDFGTNFKKEEIMTAWSQLYVNDKKFAEQMFNYCLLKGGVTWSKNTWMQYLPAEMKTRMLGWRKSFERFDNKGKGLNDDFNTIEFIDAFIRHNLKDFTFVTTYYPGQSSSDFPPYQITTPRNSGDRKSLMINTKHYTNEKIAATFTPYLRFNNKVYRFKNFISHTNQIEYEEVSDLSEEGNTVTAYNDLPPSNDFKARFSNDSWRLYDNFLDRASAFINANREFVWRMGRRQSEIERRIEERNKEKARNLRNARQVLESLNDEEYFKSKSDMTEFIEQHGSEPLSKRDAQRLAASVFRLNDPTIKDQQLQQFIDLQNKQDNMQKFTIRMALTQITGTSTKEDEKIVQQIMDNLKCFNKE